MPEQVIIVEEKKAQPFPIQKLTKEQLESLNKFIEILPELIPYLAAFGYGFIVGYQAEKDVLSGLRMGLEAIVFTKLAITLPANSSISPTQVFGVAGLTAIGLSLPSQSILDQITKWFAGVRGS